MIKILKDKITAKNFLCSKINDYSAHVVES